MGEMILKGLIAVDKMGNKKEYIKMIPDALKERIGETVTPVLQREYLIGKWKSVLKGYEGIPDEPYIQYEFLKNGKWSDGKENKNVGWKLVDGNIILLQQKYGPIPEVNDPGGISEEGFYVYSTKSGKIILSNADTSVLIELTKNKTKK